VRERVDLVPSLLPLLDKPIYADPDTSTRIKPHKTPTFIFVVMEAHRLELNNNKEAEVNHNNTYRAVSLLVENQARRTPRKNPD
jgi:hypothetical protein